MRMDDEEYDRIYGRGVKDNQPPISGAKILFIVICIVLLILGMMYPEP